jgi:hypothetical protein
VATSGLGAWAADAATTDAPATHVRTTDRPGADDPAGHHRHHGADDIVRHHRHAAHDTARHPRHGEPEPGDDHGGHHGGDDGGHGHDG